jgi:hypothetical protein
MAPISNLATTQAVLEFLQGRWSGFGFNAIWRPNDASANVNPQLGTPPMGSNPPANPDTLDHFLALNLTTETMSFTPLGLVPNRGLGQPDLLFEAVQYVQQIQDANFSPAPAVRNVVTDAPGIALVASVFCGNVIHHEPGLWLFLPTEPNFPQLDPFPTANRIGSIPHGVTIFLRGLATDVTLTNAGTPAASIQFAGATPGFVAQASSAFPLNQQNNIIPTAGSAGEQTLVQAQEKSRTFPLPVATGDYPNGVGGAGEVISPDAAKEQAPTIRSRIEIPKAGGGVTQQAATLTQQMIDQPTSYLASINEVRNANGLVLESAIQLQIASQIAIDSSSGGMQQIPTLTTVSSVSVVETDATFWLEKWTDRNDKRQEFLQIQYIQTVQLAFNGPIWPHVTVGSLTPVKAP